MSKVLDFTLLVKLSRGFLWPIGSTKKRSLILIRGLRCLKLAEIFR